MRDERRRQKLEPAYHFMIRVRLPGGVCTPEQWLKLDELARAHGGDTLRLTTRQTFQFHWVLKEDVEPTIQGLHEALLDTDRGLRRRLARRDVRGRSAGFGASRGSRRCRADGQRPRHPRRPAPITRSGTARRRSPRPSREEPFYGADLPAAEVQDRLRRPAVQRHRRLHPGSRLHRDRRRRTGSRASTSRSAAAWAAPRTADAPIRGSPT